MGLGEEMGRPQSVSAEVRTLPEGKWHVADPGGHMHDWILIFFFNDYVKNGFCFVHGSRVELGIF